MPTNPMEFQTAIPEYLTCMAQAQLDVPGQFIENIANLSTSCGQIKTALTFIGQSCDYSLESAFETLSATAGTILPVNLTSILGSLNVANMCADTCKPASVDGAMSLATKLWVSLMATFSLAMYSANI
eukprot:CAMPEP_0170600310 /NCGR_PEP_ID=MMETSP0224-20130122/17265_1 /TAXON_ID=285029 /ORGANISM="Togula jolla, Strain CCCM 725" /LENGTH=127 /DNA_ID=CAMNT_0010925025 /DNA_START=149 /DNA_END=532 /DNA_ORIENTATION=-